MYLSSINNKSVYFFQEHHTLSFLSLVLSGFLFSKMGGEFIPTLDEGDFVIQPVLKTGTSLSKTIELTTEMEKILKEKFPEVDKIVCRIGAAEVPTDPMSMEEIDMIIRLKPKNTWTSAKTKEELADKFKEALKDIPGIDYEFTQPIEMRFNELITGVRADIAIKIFGDDLNYLSRKAEEIKLLIEKVPGASDVILEKTTGLPQMNVTYNRNKIALYGVDIQTLNSYVAAAFGGEVTGSVFEGERRFDLVLRLHQNYRIDIENIKQLPVALPNGEQIPLRELANIEYTEGPAKISRENTHRMVVVSVNVRNRDLQSVVKDIQHNIDSKVTLSPGTYIEYGGQFENLQNASKRLMVAVPIALALIFIFLHFAFKSMKDTVMIFTAVPLSVVGGIAALLIRGMPFSISAGVGFIALFGIAVLNGIVLIEHLKHLQSTKPNENLGQLIYHGASDRLRPVMLTATAAAMGFFPMAISSGAGAEVQRPLATVVIGGLITSTMLTMIVLPLLFQLFHDDEGIKYKIVRYLKSKNFILIFMLLAPTLTLSAQNGVKQLTLNQCIDEAITNNKGLKAYEVQLEQKKVLSKSFWEIEKANVYFAKDQANVAENGYPLQTIGIEQSISFPTIYAINRNMRRVEMNQAELELMKQRSILIKEVSLAYYDLNFLIEKQKYFSYVDSLYNRLDNMANSQYEAGDISNLDRLNVKAKKKQTSIESSKIGLEISNAYERLSALMNIEGDFEIDSHSIDLVPISNLHRDTLPEVLQYKLQSKYHLLESKIEKHRLLPDFTMEYFYGNNRFENARPYHGFQVTLGIPLFWGNQLSKAKSNKLAANANDLMLQNHLRNLEVRYRTLTNQLNRYKEVIDFYTETGKGLSEEITRSAERSYELGEVTFYELVLSFENALKLTLDYYEAISNYNKIALEINHITMDGM